MAQLEGITIRNYRALSDVTLGRTFESRDADPLHTLLSSATSTTALYGHRRASPMYRASVPQASSLPGAGKMPAVQAAGCIRLSNRVVSRFPQGTAYG